MITVKEIAKMCNVSSSTVSNILNGKSVSCTINEKGGNVVHMRGKVIRREKMDQYVLYACRCGEKNQEVLDYIARLTKENPEREENPENGGE